MTAIFRQGWPRWLWPLGDWVSRHHDPFTGRWHWRAFNDTATRPAPAGWDDLERLYATPDRYCPACGAWLAGDALFCGAECQGAWLA